MKKCLVRFAQPFVVGLGALLWLSLSTPAAADSSDPTEQSTLPPVITLPSSADKKASAAHAEADGEPESGALPGDPWGSSVGDGVLSLRALFQLRYVTSFARESTNPRESYAVREDWLAQEGDGFSFNRLFLRVGSDPLPYLGFKMVLDFSELIDNDPEDVVKQAYITFRPIPGHLELVAGMFKVPFSTLELDASSRYEFAFFGEGNRLVNQLGFAGRDIGVQLIGAPFRKAKRMQIILGAFGGHAYGEHDLPVGTVAGRIELKPNKVLRLGVDGALQPRAITYNRPFNTSGSDVVPNPSDPRYPTQKRWDDGYAVSADVRIKKKGFMLRGEGMYGTRVDVDERYGAETFWSVWGIAAYRIQAGPLQLLPALRYEWLDTDIEHDDRGVFAQLSGSFSFLFMERVRIMLDVTAIDAQDNTPVLNQKKPLQAEPYLALDTVRGTVQLQVEL
jgi:hypothetical protein